MDKLRVHSNNTHMSWACMVRAACMVKLVVHGNTTHTSIWMDKLRVQTNNIQAHG